MGNPICHWELMVTDVERAKAFYAKVFDWTFDGMNTPEYTLIGTGKEPGGGIMKKPAEAPTAALNTYFAVDAVDQTLQRVVEAGGTVIVPKRQVPGVGWFAMFVDPDQIPIGIFEMVKAR